MGGALRIRRTRFLARTGLTLEEAFAEFYALLLHGLLKQPEGAGLPVTRHWKGSGAQSPRTCPRTRTRRTAALPTLPSC